MIVLYERGAEIRANGGECPEEVCEGKMGDRGFQIPCRRQPLMLTVEVPSTVLIFKARMYIIHVLTCLHVYHVHEMIDCQDLELQAVVSCLMCVLGTQPRSSIRAASIVCE